MGVRQAREETRMSKESKQGTKALKLEAAHLRCVRTLPKLPLAVLRVPAESVSTHAVRAEALRLEAGCPAARTAYSACDL